MGKPQQFDPKAWAKSQTGRRGGAKCSICTQPEVRDAVRAVLEVWVKERPPGLSFTAIAEMLQEHLGFTTTQGTVRQHSQNHEPALYQEVRRGSA